MYELEAFLSILVAWSYVEGILRGKRWWVAVFVLSVALLALTHNWGLFLCVGLAGATVIAARERLRLFAVAAGCIALLYVAWVPILLSQVAHTGAPWSTRPKLHDLLFAAGSVIGGDASYLVILLIGGAALVPIVRRGGGAERTVVSTLALMTAVTIGVAFVASQVSPAWTARYFAVIAGPVLLLASEGIVRARGLGLATLVVLVVLWAGYTTHDDKENARGITHGVQAYLRPGELIISTHPEQTPVLRYYLGPGYRWATTLGPTTDPNIFDWRDAVSRLQDARARPTMRPASRNRAPGWRIRGCRARLPRLPCLEGEVDEARLAEGDRVELVAGARRPLQARRTRCERRDRPEGELLQASAGLCLSQDALESGPAVLMTHDDTETRHSFSAAARPASPRAISSARRGRDVVVLEAEDQIGGLAKTVERDGYRFDLGGHRFFTKVTEVDDLWHEVLGDEFLPPAAHVADLLEQPLSRLPASRVRRDHASSGRSSSRGASARTSRRAVAPQGRGGVARGLGHEPLRPPPLRALLQVLQREGLGGAGVRDPRGVGGAADQGPLVLLGGEGGVLRQPRQQDQEPHLRVQLPALRPGPDVGRDGRGDPRAGRRGAARLAGRADRARGRPGRRACTPAASSTGPTPSSRRCRSARSCR